MDTHSQDARYAPPQSPVDSARPARVSGALAGHGIRLAAAMVDGVFAMAALWLLSRLTPLNVWAGNPTGYWALQPWRHLLTGLAVFLLLQGYLLATRGQTLGKLIFKTRIVRPGGARASSGRIALRYGVGMLSGFTAGTSMIYGLIDILLIFRASRRCLHDTIADTVVVNT